MPPYVLGGMKAITNGGSPQDNLQELAVSHGL